MRIVRTLDKEDNEAAPCSHHHTECLARILGAPLATLSPLQRHKTALIC